MGRNGVAMGIELEEKSIPNGSDLLRDMMTEVQNAGLNNKEVTGGARQVVEILSFQ